MRGRNIKLWFDTFMWYLVYLLPLFALLFAIFRTGTIVSMDSIFSSLGLDLSTNNIIYSTFNDIFGASGSFPLFVNNGILLYATYFICVYLIHLAVDILIFLPRLIENVADKFTKNGGVKDD